MSLIEHYTRNMFLMSAIGLNLTQYISFRHECLARAARQGPDLPDNQHLDRRAAVVQRGFFCEVLEFGLVMMIMLFCSSDKRDSVYLYRNLLLKLTGPNFPSST